MVTTTLNDRQRRFVEEYLVDFNATRAAISAGYAKKYANTNASKLLQNTTIQNAISDAQKKTTEKLGLTKEKVIMEVVRLAFSDLRKAFDNDGKLLPVHAWPEDVAAAISSVKVTTRETEGGDVSSTNEVKLWDKGNALEKLFKHLGLYEKHNEQKSDPLADLIKSLHENNRVGMPANANP